MKRWSGLALCAGMLAGQAMAADAAGTDDPYLWLEDVEGAKPLDWVRARNAESAATIEQADGFAALQDDLRAILDSDAKIPMIEKIGDHYYNFWRDRAHERGVWRRTTLEEYRKPEPAWETVLDLDALNKAEGENWVWHGADCLKPDYSRCLVALSRGGADADVTREFDLGTRDWVKDGFFRPEAKGALQWIDRDTVYVFTDFGPGSQTSSGYPRIVKEWKRGTPLAAATTVYEGKPDDLYISAGRDHTTGYVRDLVRRSIDFYSDEVFLRDATGLRKIEAPDSAKKSLYRQWLLVELREPWNVGGREWPKGALLAAKLDDFMAGKRELQALFEPDAHNSLADYVPTRNRILLNVLEDVKSRLYRLDHEDGAWTRTPLAGLPESGTLAVGAVDADASDAYFLTVEDYLTPTTLMWGDGHAAPEPLKRMPDFFDAAPYAISQHFATSKDGTRVPYFMVARKDLPLDGSHPTLLYGYGGFEVSLTPAYSAAVGRGWLQYGGVYVVANIRGGGEYGPRWHQAALKQNRLRAYEDFAAVAEDLVARKVTRPQRLGIQGGSNGGLLMGNMFTLYPKLFGAVVCQVPLLDMRRYNQLLAGASWMAEYGDPDKPEEWRFIRTFSPYQNVKPDVAYPPVLFMTSTRDDRVHPGHARKMMARMREQGHDVQYFENIEGGHGGAANNAQRAHMQALAFTFLRQRLMPAAP